MQAEHHHQGPDDAAIGQDDSSQMRLVSVIVRSTNRAELSDTLASIARQTYPSIEVILVDVAGDGRLSTRDRCGAFALRVASAGWPLGRAAAANLGLDTATGRYAIFLDDDDWFLPEHIEGLVNALTFARHERLAYAGVECRRQTPDGDWETIGVFNEPHDPTRLLIENYIPIHAALFELSLLGEHVRFDESLDLYEDWDFWTQLSKLTNFWHVDKITAIYRISETSGFGAHVDSATAHAALFTYFNKWRGLWSLKQVVAIAGYTKHQITTARQQSHQEIDKIEARAQSELEAIRRLIREKEERLTDLSAAADAQSRHKAQIAKALDECHSHVAELLSTDKVRATHFLDLHTKLDEERTRVAGLETSLNQSIRETATLRSEIDVLRSQLYSSNQGLMQSEATRTWLKSEHDRVLVLERASRQLAESLALALNDLQTKALWSVAARLIAIERRVPAIPRLLLGAGKLVWWTLRLRLRQALRSRARIQRIVASGIFDESGYVRRYPEVALTGYRPIIHWLLRGAQERRDPGPLFDTRWYLDQVARIDLATVDPLSHYLQTGASAELSPHPLFDPQWYLFRHPIEPPQGMSLLEHFIQQGAAQGLNPHPLFDIGWYRRRNPRINLTGENPLLHFITQGARQGCDPHPLFPLEWYLYKHPEVRSSETNPLIHFITEGRGSDLDPHVLFDTAWYRSSKPRLAGLHPFIHYLWHGWRERRSPHPLFDPDWYLQSNPDLQDEDLDLFRHFIETGAAEGRDPHPLFSTRLYLKENPDILGANPLYHYLVAGWRENRRPHQLFDGTWYLEQYPQVARSGLNPLIDYLLFGAAADRNPSPWFDTRWYRETYPECADTNPLVHYILIGAAKGYRPTPTGEKGRDVALLRENASGPIPRLAPPGPLASGAHPDVQLGVNTDLLGDLNDWPDGWKRLLAPPNLAPERILVIDWKPPTPDRDSGSYRMRMILEILREADERVDFVGDRAAESDQYVADLNRLGISVFIGHTQALEQLRRNGSDYRAVWIARPELAQAYLPIVRAFAVKARVIYDTVDLHWVRFERGIPYDADPAQLRRKADDYYRLELSNARSSDITVAITQEERATLLEQAPELHVEIIPNIHSVHPTRAPLSNRADLFFIGGFNHTPNVDAVLFFVREVLPIIHSKRPDVRFNIVGSDMPDRIKTLASERINPVGYVADVTPWFESSRVFVSPLRHGAGMKGKIGQSLSFGLPVVTTAIGAEGLSLTHGEDALIADQAEPFADAVLRLYTDDPLWERISVAGRRLIESRYSKAAVAPQLLALFQPRPATDEGP